MERSYRWKNVAIGGGGYVTGMAIHPAEPRLVYIRTDVGGAFRWDGENRQWLPLTDCFGLELENFYGIESIAVDPGDANTLYIAAGKYIEESPSDVLKSIDRGRTWSRTNLNVRMDGNKKLRWAGERLAVDPNCGEIVYFGSRFDGLWRSREGAANWERVDTFPVPGEPGSGILFVVFDKSSGSMGKPTPTVYAGVIGEGIYRSLDEGETWTCIHPEIVNPRRAAAASDGTLYITAGDVYAPGTSRGVFKYRAGIWTDITPDSVYPEYCGLAVDSENPERILCSVRFDAFWNPIYSTMDGGRHWTLVTENVTRHGNVPWWTSSYFAASLSALAVDPFDRSRVWFCDWYGVWMTPDIDAKPSHWYTFEDGHEEMVTFTMACPPEGAKLLSAIADNDGMYHDILGSYPVRKFGNPALQETTGIDFCEAQPHRLARVGSWNWGTTGSGGYSSDGGVTWTKFASWPFGANGKLAMSATEPERIVVVPIQDTPKLTVDGGETWLDTKGAPSGAVEKFWSWNHPLAADRVNGSLFYLYMSGTLYRSINGGTDWEAVNSCLPADDMHLVKTPPGIEGAVWVSLDEKGLYASADKGSSFRKIEGVERAFLFAFGKPMPGSAWPTLFLYGRVNGEDGIFLSEDTGSTWTRINDDSTPVGCSPNCMEGDRQVYGRVYIGTNGRGIYFGEPIGQ